MPRWAAVIAACFAAVLGVGSASAQTEAVDYCRAQAIGRYCVDLYAATDPTIRVEAQIYPVVIANRPATLFPAADLPASLREVSRATGRLVIHRRRVDAPANDYVTWCTASVISDDYILTAAHCVPGAARDEYVVQAALLMGYQRPNDRQGTTIYPVVGNQDGCRPGTPAGAVCPEPDNFDHDEHADFAIVRIGRADGESAADAYGAVSLAPRDVEPRAMVFVPQHPWSLPLHGDFAPLGDPENATQTRHYVTTFQMSSGSPVIVVEGRSLVGLHVSGGGSTCVRVGDLNVMIGCSNRFTTINAIAARSPIVAELRRQAAAETPVTTLPNPPLTIAGPVALTSYASLVERARGGDPTSNWILGVKAEYAQQPSEMALLGVRRYPGEPARAADPAQAVAYYRTAANANYAPAIVDLASFYYYGGAVPQDQTRAIRMFEDAALRGDPRAMSWLAAIYRGVDGPVPQDWARSLGYLEQGAAAGDARAQYDLALLKLYGSDLVAVDHVEAVRLLRQAADQEYGQAQFMLAEQYFAGVEGVTPRDLDRARVLYQAAQAGGVSEASIRLEQVALHDAADSP